MLLRGLLREYDQARLGRQWSISSLLPGLPARIRNSSYANYLRAGRIPNIVGYGIRINERLNDVLILGWAWLAILVTGIFIFVYAKCTGDHSSAFGMGAYLVAALTIYIQLQYAWLRRG